MCSRHYLASPEVRERKAKFRKQYRVQYTRPELSPSQWSRQLESQKRYRANNWEKVRAIERRYQEKRKARFWLPPDAPGELVEACRLLGALKKEMKT